MIPIRPMRNIRARVSPDLLSIAHSSMSGGVSHRSRPPDRSAAREHPFGDNPGVRNPENETADANRASECRENGAGRRDVCADVAIAFEATDGIVVFESATGPCRPGGGGGNGDPVDDEAA